LSLQYQLSGYLSPPSYLAIPVKIMAAADPIDPKKLAYGGAFESSSPLAIMNTRYNFKKSAQNG